MKLPIKDIKGGALGELEVNFRLIENKQKGNQAVHDVIVAYNAAQRSGTACTKTVGEVAGSNKKPWKQKGTGRARAGSLRSPLWRGGGVVFGPRPRDFSKKVNGKTRQLALRKALSERLRSGDLIVVEDLKLESHKTKGFLAVLKALQLTDSTTLFVKMGEDANLLRAAGNVPDVEITTGDLLNTYQVLKYDKLVFTKSAFEFLGQRLAE